MKKSILVISIGLFLAFSAVAVGHCNELVLNNTPVGAYFRPNGGCTDAIISPES